MDEQIQRLRQTAALLLLAIWRGMNPDYKSRYRMNIWEQFESAIASAAQTNNLGKFINSLCGKLDATVGTTKQERADCEAILNSGEDRALLKLMREETALVLLMVRVAVQEHREVYDQRQQMETIETFEIEEEE